MIDEPEITLDDTTPRQPVQIEEPPIHADDTSPSLVMRPVKSRSNPAQRLLAATMLIGALVLTAAAAWIWLNGSSEDEKTTPATAISQMATITPTTAAPPTENTDPITESNPVVAPVTQPTILPTAAADEIAVALLTPAPLEPAAFERFNQPFTIARGTGRTRVIQYTVQDGDTLENIAENFGLSSHWTLIWSNSRTIYNSLRPGSQLNIMPEDGVYLTVSRPTTIQEIADEYEVDPYTIIDSDYNPDLYGSTPQTLLVEGMWVVIPGGKGEEINLLPPVTNAGNASGVVTGSYTLWGCTAEIGAGSLPFTRPVSSYEFMQGFSYGGHEAVDLGGVEGAPIYAAGSGTVVFAGRNSTGYGNLVVIAHGSVFSLYGHLQSVSVSCGQSVTAGQQIGALGNTGNSSGPHLHFELRSANWGAINPFDYQGF